MRIIKIGQLMALIFSVTILGPACAGLEISISADDVEVKIPMALKNKDMTAEACSGTETTENAKNSTWCYLRRSRDASKPNVCTLESLCNALIDMDDLKQKAESKGVELKQFEASSITGTVQHFDFKDVDGNSVTFPAPAPKVTLTDFIGGVVDSAILQHDANVNQDATIVVLSKPIELNPQFKIEATATQSAIDKFNTTVQKENGVLLVATSAIFSIEATEEQLLQDNGFLSQIDTWIIKIKQQVGVTPGGDSGGFFAQ